MSGSEAKEVNFVRLGRTALYYQTRDGQQSGIWNTATSSWDSLPTDQNAAVHKTIQLARQQVVPDLLSLPLPAITRGGQQ